MSEDDERLLSTARVAKIFGRTTLTIRRWIEDGKIEARFINGRYYISKAEVDRKLSDSQS